MKPWPTTEDVLSDIEFELIQGAISSDELGRGVQSVKRYQNKLRGEILQLARRRDRGLEIASWLFRLNDMFIALFQEVVAAIQSLRLESRRIAQAANFARPRAVETPVISTSAATIPGSESADEGPLLWSQMDMKQVEDSMQPETLQVKPDVRVSRVPIVGTLLGCVRTMLHDLALFYVGRLSAKQASVNQIYGDRILRLMQQVQGQQEQIDSLLAQVEMLQARLSFYEHS